jgi:hypothetical protein
VHPFTFGGAASAQAAGGGLGAPASGGFGIFGASGYGFGFGGARPSGFSFGSTAAAAAPGPLPGSYCKHTKVGFGVDTVTKVRVLSYIPNPAFGQYPYQCLNVITNEEFGSLPGDLTKIPDDELTPLEMSFRQPFRPSAVLRAAGIEGAAVMDVVELRHKLNDETIITPEYNTLHIEYPVRWGPTVNEKYAEMGGVRVGVLHETGWFDDTTMSGLMLRMASEFGAVTTDCTLAQVQAHFRKCWVSGRETFLLIGGQQWRTGSKILSPRGSLHVDYIYPDKILPSKDDNILRSKDEVTDLTESPPSTGVLKLPEGSPAIMFLGDKIVEKSSNQLPRKVFQMLDLSVFDNILVEIHTGNHWVLGRIRPKAHTTVIYDSCAIDRAYWLEGLRQFRNDTWKNKLQYRDALISPVTGTLLSQLEKTAFDQTNKIAWVDDVNDVNFNKRNKFPTQGDASACGVFVTMYIAYMLTRHEDKIITDVTQDNCVKIFRPWLARMLCEEPVPASP